MTAEELIEESERALAPRFRAVERIAEHNQEKVLKAFQACRVALRHFNPSTGYGYGDEGRFTLGEVFALSMGAEAGIVSPAMLSGTHALSVALFGILRPGDKVLSLSGMPYDTLRGVICGEGNGSLKDFGISFECLDLSEDGKFDMRKAAERIKALGKDLRMIYIQRSRGYELRDAFTADEIGEACSRVRALGFDGCIFVDNCYGEFVEEKEPCDVGADLAVGSLIKNPGGGVRRRQKRICGTDRETPDGAFRRQRSRVLRLRLPRLLPGAVSRPSRRRTGGERKPSHRQVHGRAGV